MPALDIPMSKPPDVLEIDLSEHVQLAGCGVTAENPVHTAQMTKRRKRPIEVRKY